MRVGEANRQRLFLCHASDDKAFARRLARSLRNYGVDVWFDEWKLRVGDSLSASIERGIRGSRYVIVLLSSRALSRRWVLAELRAAMARELNRRPTLVIPALLDLSPTKLPALLFDRLAVDFRRGYSQGVDAILLRLGMSTRRRRSEYPSSDDVAKIVRRLPFATKLFLWANFRSRLAEAWEPRVHKFYLREDARTLRSCSCMGLVKYGHLRSGVVTSDEPDGIGWEGLYQVRLTNLGKSVVTLLVQEKREKERMRLEGDLKNA